MEHVSLLQANCLGTYIFVSLHLSIYSMCRCFCSCFLQVHSHFEDNYESDYKLQCPAAQANSLKSNLAICQLHTVLCLVSLQAPTAFTFLEPCLFFALSLCFYTLLSLFFKPSYYDSNWVELPVNVGNHEDEYFRLLWFPDFSSGTIIRSKSEDYFWPTPCKTKDNRATLCSVLIR